METFSTVISGVAVYVIGQAIFNFVFEPIKQFNKERGDTSYLLLSHLAKISNASKDDPEIARELKEMGAALISTMKQIPFYDFLVRTGVFGLPSKGAVFEAARELNGIAYNTSPGPTAPNAAVLNTEALKKIAQLLKIQTTYIS